MEPGIPFPQAFYPPTLDRQPSCQEALVPDEVGRGSPLLGCALNNPPSLCPGPGQAWSDGTRRVRRAEWARPVTPGGGKLLAENQPGEVMGSGGLHRNKDFNLDSMLWGAANVNVKIQLLKIKNQDSDRALHPTCSRSCAGCTPYGNTVPVSCLAIANAPLRASISPSLCGEEGCLGFAPSSSFQSL